MDAGEVHQRDNGVTPRRFMVLSNPKLSRLISSRIGEGWIKNLQELRGLESSVREPEFSKKSGE